MDNSLQLKKLAHYEAKMKYYHNLIGGATMKIIKLENAALPPELTPEKLAEIVAYFKKKDSTSPYSFSDISITYIPGGLGRTPQYSFEYKTIKYTITIDDASDQKAAALAKAEAAALAKAEAKAEALAKAAAEAKAKATGLAKAKPVALTSAKPVASVNHI